MYVMGIDGGGSSLRVVITTRDLTVCGQAVGESANPSSIGRAESARRVGAAMRAALSYADLQPGQISAVGIGIAGAAASHSADWLRVLVSEHFPGASVAVSSDYEIALVGAHGERRGLLALAGTGSLAYGVNGAGESALAGGWGYLLGDEGGGYWLGAAALRAAARAADGRGRETALLPAVLKALNLSQPLDLITWMYSSGSRTRDAAALARLVLACAETDAVAGNIVAEGARELALAVRAVSVRLQLTQCPIAFAGSLLSEMNPLSRRLCGHLGLEGIPAPRYSPAVGAAILALQTQTSSQS